MDSRYSRERYRPISKSVLKTLRRASREAARRGSLAENYRLPRLNRGSLRLAEHHPERSAHPQVERDRSVEISNTFHYQYQHGREQNLAALGYTDQN